MFKKFKESLKFGDIIIVIFIIVAALLLELAFVLPSKADGVAVISKDNEILKEINLSQSENITFALDNIKGYTFEVKNKKIRIANATCPDKICINMGYISKTGQTIVCIPAHLMIEIKSNTKEYDVVVG